MITVDILEESGDDVSCERVVRIPVDVGCVAGHFPGLAIVPGFVQLSWALETARRLVGAAPLRRIEALKFKEVVRPGQTIVIRIERSDGVVRFALRRGDAIVSSGRAIYA